LPAVDGHIAAERVVEVRPRCPAAGAEAGDVAERDGLGVADAGDAAPRASTAAARLLRAP